MRPAPFELLQPTSLSEALAALAGGARPLAGGQSLLQSMRLRDAEPARLVDLEAVPELDDAIRIEPDEVRIGARVTHRQLAKHEELRRVMPWLSEAARELGDVQVRNLGTVIGNICWADPRANHVVAALASEAELVVAAADGDARLPVAEVLSGFRQTVLGARIATGLHVPRVPERRGIYIEFSRQRRDLALVNVCAIQTGRDIRLAVGGIDSRPVLLTAPDRRLLLEQLDSINTLGLEPIEDQHGSAEYKFHLAHVLGARAVAALETAP